MYHPAEAPLAGSENQRTVTGTVMVRQELTISWNLLRWQLAPIETGKAINSV